MEMVLQWHHISFDLAHGKSLTSIPTKFSLLYSGRVLLGCEALNIEYGHALCRTPEGARGKCVQYHGICSSVVDQPLMSKPMLGCLLPAD